MGRKRHSATCPAHCPGGGCDLRVAAELSQEDLAFAAGLHRTAISHIEQASRSAKLETIEKLARALRVQPADLMPPLRKR